MSLTVGDCRVTLARWAAEGVRVQCVVTSPPYWGLRDYGTAPLVWGDAACPHEWHVEVVPIDNRTAATMPSGPQMARGVERADAYRDKTGPVATSAERATCLRCAAWRGSLGLEPTPDLYVAHLVDVFRLVRDVMADDATLWLNLGDSFASQGGPNTSTKNTGQQAVLGRACCPSSQSAPAVRPQAQRLKPKDLCMIPARVALALQADGWYLRSDIIWAKPNPMPESVTDRPTKAHEYLFLLTKRATYYYDAEAIRETSIHAGREIIYDGTQKNCTAGDSVNDRRTLIDRPVTVAPFRNRRSVWTIATTPYPDAHFATFPEDLVKPCILAGSRPGDTVLDPFMGSGTVAQVAQDLGRRWLGCELNPAYAPMGEKRTRQQGLAL